ncbi:hypothetical protein ACFE04_012730 [Oxalis oulophora]
MNIFKLSKPKWSADFFGCHTDVGTCCLTCWLPCVTFGRIAHVVDDGDSSCCAQGCVYCLLMMVSCHWILSCIYREKMRSKYGLPAEPCCDCGVHYFCECCALCQEYGELKNRGKDPADYTSAPNPLKMFK